MTLTGTLSPEHYEEIVVDSCVTPDVALARGYRTLTAADQTELEELGFQRYLTQRDDAYPGLLVPMYGADGTVRGHQFKPAVPRTRSKADGTPSPVKYESPKGADLVLDVPEFTRGVLAELNVPLWVTEGVKKVDSLVSQGLAAIGLTGVFNWRNKLGTLGDWEDIPLKGRTVVLCFDADAAGNRNVQLAMSRLGAWLKSRGVAEVKYIVTPSDVSGATVKGVDDFFAAGGDVASLAAVATNVAPGAGEKDAAFTDAFLVEELAEAMTSSFCWAGGLGWMRWTGRVWREVPDVEPLEAVRVWASEQFEKVLTDQRKDPSRNLQGQISGWRAVLGKSRLTALRDLAKGLLQSDPSDFDADPDILTCRNGTVHLPTGKLLPFDPEHKTTKMAAAEYRPGCTHADWESALSALPPALLPWYQDRIGQSVTGYKTPDHTLVLSYGSGSNGKSVLAAVIRESLGTYGILVSDRVLMVQGDAHPTELMDLRGARYAVLEETPEARHLNVQRLKQTVGTPVIRARKIRQDTVEFLATHSLFINTNHKPIVNETDHGTWRRLALLDFPFTFRKPGEPLLGPLDRTGNPRLEYAADNADVRAAALAWMVAGARAWYARERMMMPLPDAVEKSTRQWRSETDMIVGFADDVLLFEPEGVTPSQEMLDAFNAWAEERGHRTWNDKTFASRFGAHEIARKAKVGQSRKRIGSGNPKRVWTGVRLRKSDDPWADGLPEPTEPEAPREYGGCVCGSTSVTLADHADYCSFDREEQRAARGEESAVEVVRSEPQEPNRTDPPTHMGFDLETAAAEELFTGRHEGPFVRLAGYIEDPYGLGPTVKPAPEWTADIVSDLDVADVLYGHNILGFDLLALAYHHGADYDALAEKAIDTQVISQLLDPPGARGADRVSHKLDAVAHRLGHTGKTDDIKRLASKHGGFDRIPVNDPEYQEYLKGDLEATRFVYEKLTYEDLSDYMRREMRVVALQNRMTLNGWAIDTELLAERVAEEAAKVAEAKERLAEYGVPMTKPDRFKLKLKAEWPESMRNLSIDGARDALKADPEQAVRVGMADRIPGEVYASPWATDVGRDALVKAFADAGAPYVPRTKTGALKLSAEALGDGMWFDKDRGKASPGMLHPKAYGHLPAVRELCGVLELATGATSKYAEIQRWTNPRGRVHPKVSAPQASGRWASNEPASANLAQAHRAVYVADPGRVTITCDLSQVDVRALAGHSQDPALIAMLQPGMDYHAEMAEIMSGDRTRRGEYKPVSHGLNYNQSPRTVAEQHGLDVAATYRAKERHSERLHVFEAWKLQAVEHARTGALLDNGFGRMMRCDPERAWTQAPALYGQGGARDIMTESMLRFVDRAEESNGMGRQARDAMRGVVHDELVISVPEEEAEYWQRLLKEAFTWEWRGVPILAEVSNPAYRWSDCTH